MTQEDSVASVVYWGARYGLPSSPISKGPCTSKRTVRLKIGNVDHMTSLGAMHWTKYWEENKPDWLQIWQSDPDLHNAGRDVRNGGRLGIASSELGVDGRRLQRAITPRRQLCQISQQ